MIRAHLQVTTRKIIDKDSFIMKIYFSLSQAIAHNRRFMSFMIGGTFTANEFQFFVIVAS